MATLTANRCYALATFDVERVVTMAGEPDCLYRERYALRSDGKVLHQIVWTEDKDGDLRWYCRCSKGKCGNCVEGKTARLAHSSGYAIKGALSEHTRDGKARLRALLVRKGYAIVGEK